MARKATSALDRVAIEAATQIATALTGTLQHDGPWVTVEQSFERSPEGELQYGSITLFSLDARLDFGIWLERTTDLGSADLPILCAAFGAYSGADAKALVTVAEREGVRRQPYRYGQEERLIGFAWDPVLDIPSNVARFLSSYRPAGNFDVEPAIHQFRNFWDAWAHKVAIIAGLPQRRPALHADWNARAIRGLVGELTVLARSDMSNATWVGMDTEAHDIEHGRLLIEVKTRSGETATLSRRQIESYESDHYFVAIVDLPSEAHLALRDAGKHDAKLHPILDRHREGIETYLRRRGVESDPDLLAAISRAVRLSAKAVTFHRLVPPDGFVAALSALERFGRVADLAIECGRDWFIPIKLPR